MLLRAQYTFLLTASAIQASKQAPISFNKPQLHNRKPFRYRI